MTAPRVSVVLPTYNREPTLSRAMNSVLAQTLSDLELIVVDDGSTDATADLVKGIADPRIVYLRRERPSGVSAARNAGIAIARGAFVAFQDSDDEWLPEKLAKQIQLIDKLGSRCGLVGCELKRDVGSAVITVRWAEDATDRTRISPEGHVARLSAFMQTAVFRAECLRELGPFDEQLQVCEDWELTLRAIGKWTFGNVPEPLVVSYELADGLSSFKDRRAFALRRIYDRHGELIKADPRTHASFLCEMSKADFYAGHSADARGSAMQAMKIRPLDPRASGLIALSFLDAATISRFIAVYRSTKLKLGFGLQR